MDPLFQGVQANDSKDLVNFIIMTLHGELNKIKTKSMNINNPSTQAQRNQQFMLNNFIQNFQAENKSIISDLFYAMNCNMTQCSNCKTISYNYQIYFFLIFPLEEVRKFKLENNNGFNNFNNNEVNIYDCFDFDKRYNYMDGENAMYCNYCKLTCGSTMCTYLTTGPEILIIILNRGKGIEFNIKINFEESLDLSNYIEYKNTGCKYKLIGVITHIGESSMSGHFIAYCRDPIKDDWYKYNDAIVNKVENFQNEVINFAMPYLLFYQKING
jgi:ubiquitin C-terminal hydrolase